MIRLAVAGSIIIAVLSLVMWKMGDDLSKKTTELKAARAELKAITKVVTVERKQDEVSTNVSTKTEAQLVKTRTITKDIIRYVPQILPDRGYVIRNGAVCVHDAAAIGNVSGLSDSACKSDDAPSGITDTQAFTTIAENYGAYHECADRLTGLQAWTSEQGKIKR